MLQLSIIRKEEACLSAFVCDAQRSVPWSLQSIPWNNETTRATAGLTLVPLDY
jgi:hypothetical protein